MKPVIAITPEAVDIGRFDGRGAFCSFWYTQAIEAAGGVPVILPLTRDSGLLEHFLRTCDGLLLTGGGDVSEKFYSRRLTDAERATIRGTDELRDEMEIYLVREALDADLPMLGICRGMQVMNVAADGTLVPDIKLRKPDALLHRHAQPDAFAHTVEWEAGRRLAGILGSGCESVNSTHHQALDRIAPGFDVVARAPDGIVEAIENPAARFACGVEFHPERLLRVAPQFLRLFEALVEAARKR
jgi:putative glutamine amidotransferase